MYGFRYSHQANGELQENGSTFHQHPYSVSEHTNRIPNFARERVGKRRESQRHFMAQQWRELKSSPPLGTDSSPQLWTKTGRVNRLMYDNCEAFLRLPRLIAGAECAGQCPYP